MESLLVPAAAAAGLAIGRAVAPLARRYDADFTDAWAWGTSALTAVVFAVLTIGVGARAALPACLVLGAVGSLLGVIDVRVKRLPDPLTLPAYPAGAVLLAIAAAFTPDGALKFAHAVIGLIVLWAMYWIQHFLFPDAIGRGDVKLAGVLGLHLGWFGQDAWLLGVLGGFLLGGVYAFAVILRGGSRKSEFAYGPFMLLGALIGISAG
ncbi:prepilin peptidase [Actinomadura bangladeshensis]|nr:A24 family peptidase [Actinomadura bangladeshensis]